MLFAKSVPVHHFLFSCLFVCLFVCLWGYHVIVVSVSSILVSMYLHLFMFQCIRILYCTFTIIWDFSRNCYLSAKFSSICLLCLFFVLIFVFLHVHHNATNVFVCLFVCLLMRLSCYCCSCVICPRFFVFALIYFPMYWHFVLQFYYNLRFFQTLLSLWII